MPNRSHWPNPLLLGIGVPQKKQSRAPLQQIPTCRLGCWCFSGGWAHRLACFVSFWPDRSSPYHCRGISGRSSTITTLRPQLQPQLQPQPQLNQLLLYSHNPKGRTLDYNMIDYISTRQLHFFLYLSSSLPLPSYLTSSILLRLSLLLPPSSLSASRRPIPTMTLTLYLQYPAWMPVQPPTLQRLVPFLSLPPEISGPSCSTRPRRLATSGWREGHIGPGPRGISTSCCSSECLRSISLDLTLSHTSSSPHGHFPAALNILPEARQSR
jgi:hypothetical protein